MRSILVNKWRTPDGTLLHSKHVHDYVSHKDKVSGETYFIDGGASYCRMSVNAVPMTNECIYEDDPIEKIREDYGRMTIDPTTKTSKYKLLKDMSNEHLENAIVYNYNRGFGLTNKASIQYMRELIYRAQNHIVIRDKQHFARENFNTNIINSLNTDQL